MKGKKPIQLRQLRRAMREQAAPTIVPKPALKKPSKLVAYILYPNNVAGQLPKAWRSDGSSSFLVVYAYNAMQARHMAHAESGDENDTLSHPWLDVTRTVCKPLSRYAHKPQVIVQAFHRNRAAIYAVEDIVSLDSVAEVPEDVDDEPRDVGAPLSVFQGLADSANTFAAGLAAMHNSARYVGVAARRARERLIMESETPSMDAEETACSLDRMQAACDECALSGGTGETRGEIWDRMMRHVHAIADSRARAGADTSIDDVIETILDRFMRGTLALRAIRRARTQG